VEHAVPFEAVRPWRTAAILASGVAALELLALIVAGTMLLGHSVASHGTRAAAKPAASKPATTKPSRQAELPRAKTRVVVLNGNGEAGAAAAEASAIRARGYKIAAVGNAPRSSVGPTLVMYRPGFAAEAKRLARDTGISIVTALDGLQPSSLRRAQLVIVLGA
jgi:ABC-type Fe3+-hydroxamate transport system substrate-binding protein